MQYPCLDWIVLKVELLKFTIKTSMSALTNLIDLTQWNTVVSHLPHQRKAKGSFHTHLQTTKPKYAGVPS